MTLADHLYFLLIAIGSPVVGYISFNRLIRRVEAGETISPTHLYNMTAISHWTLFAVLLALWALSNRSWASLGFGLEVNALFLVGVALTIAAVAVLVIQLRSLDNASEEELQSTRRQLGKLEIILPRNGNELGRFYGLSLTAGIVEETLWRGFIFWYLGHVMPLWAAAVVSAVGFGLAHAYQGKEAVPRVIVVGGVFAGLYLLTGSLWLPMILHAAVDVLQGRTIYGVIQRTGSASGMPIHESP